MRHKNLFFNFTSFENISLSLSDLSRHDTEQDGGRLYKKTKKLKNKNELTWENIRLRARRRLASTQAEQCDNIDEIV